MSFEADPAKGSCEMVEGTHLAYHARLEDGDIGDESDTRGVKTTSGCIKTRDRCAEPPPTEEASATSRRDKPPSDEKESYKVTETAIVSLDFSEQDIDIDIPDDTQSLADLFTEKMFIESPKEVRDLAAFVPRSYTETVTVGQVLRMIAVLLKKTPDENRNKGNRLVAQAMAEQTLSEFSHNVEKEMTDKSVDRFLSVVAKNKKSLNDMLVSSLGGAIPKVGDRVYVNPRQIRVDITPDNAEAFMTAAHVEKCFVAISEKGNELDVYIPPFFLDYSQLKIPPTAGYVVLTKNKDDE